MLELLLLRHAKSAWDDPALDDHERPLNARGRRAAAVMGSYLAEQGLIPDRALVSSALRTQETWRRLKKRWNTESPPADLLEGLYLAAPSTILATIRQAPAKARRLLVLGHNPGIERLARRLASSDSEAAAWDALQAKYPTAALAWFQFEADDWAQIREGRLIRFVVPKDLEEAAGGD